MLAARFQLDVAEEPEGRLELQRGLRQVEEEGVLARGDQAPQDLAQRRRERRVAVCASEVEHHVHVGEHLVVGGRHALGDVLAPRDSGLHHLGLDAITSPLHRA